jgi:hypothetical protein
MSFELQRDQVTSLREVTDELRALRDYLNGLQSQAIEVVEFDYEGGTVATVQLKTVKQPRGVVVGQCLLKADDGTVAEALGVAWRFTPTELEHSITVNAVNNLSAGTLYSLRLIVIGGA